MKMKRNYRIATALKVGISALALSLPATSGALPLPAGWTCSGNCGSLGPDGVVTAPPTGSTYSWVSTNGGMSGNNLGLGSDTNGSIAWSPVFSASAGDTLEFYFNYVTTDGAGYADYGWARLLDSSMTEVALLFTARTTPGGNTVPGFGMPAIDATIDPSTVSIIAGGPTWSPLGASSGSCFDTGCGYTEWIKATYDIMTAGDYILEFGVSNWDDELYDSGLAFAGTTIEGKPIETVPEPGILALLGIGLGGLAASKRKDRRHAEK